MKRYTNPMQNPGSNNAREMNAMMELQMRMMQLQREAQRLHLCLLLMLQKYGKNQELPKELMPTEPVNIWTGQVNGNLTVALLGENDEPPQADPPPAEVNSLGSGQPDAGDDIHDGPSDGGPDLPPDDEGKQE